MREPMPSAKSVEELARADEREAIARHCELYAHLCREKRTRAPWKWSRFAKDNMRARAQAADQLARMIREGVAR